MGHHLACGGPTARVGVLADWKAYISAATYKCGYILRPGFIVWELCVHTVQAAGEPPYVCDLPGYLCALPDEECASPTMCAVRGGGLLSRLRGRWQHARAGVRCRRNLGRAQGVSFTSLSLLSLAVWCAGTCGTRGCATASPTALMPPTTAAPAPPTRARPAARTGRRCRLWAARA